MTKKYDFLVIGSGIAGMSFALKVASKGKVALICKTTLDEANTALAQGGVASVSNLEVDDFEKHIHDTMVAGDWLSDPVAVRKVVEGAPDEVLLVLDGSTGQNAFEQARQFVAATDVNALAITKLDGTAKGGVVIGISDQFKVPVKYIGLGEGINDLQVFHKAEFVESLFAD